VAFSATGSASGCATGPTFLWSFGDGTTSTQQNPSKTYNSSGPINWQLTVSASQSGGGGSTISTAAGGESEGSPASGASFYRLNAVARDPLGRGIYLAAANFKTHVIYFVNTGNSSATLAGKTIAPGITRILAGGGNLFPNENVSGLDADLSLIYGLAVSSDGRSVYAGGYADNAIVRFKRNTSTGALTPKGCVADPDSNPSGCAATVQGLAVPGPPALSAVRTMPRVPALRRLVLIDIGRSFSDPVAETRFGSDAIPDVRKLMARTACSSIGAASRGGKADPGGRPSGR